VNAAPALIGPPQVPQASLQTNHLTFVRLSSAISTNGQAKRATRDERAADRPVM